MQSLHVIYAQSRRGPQSGYSQPHSRRRRFPSQGGLRSSLYFISAYRDIFLRKLVRGPTRVYETWLCYPGCIIPHHSHSVFSMDLSPPPSHQMSSQTTLGFVSSSFAAHSSLSSPFGSAPKIIPSPSNSVYYYPLCIWKGSP